MHNLRQDLEIVDDWRGQYNIECIIYSAHRETSSINEVILGLLDVLLHKYQFAEASQIPHTLLGPSIYLSEFFSRSLLFVCECYGGATSLLSAPDTSTLPTPCLLNYNEISFSFSLVFVQVRILLLSSSSFTSSLSFNQVVTRFKITSFFAQMFIYTLPYWARERLTKSQTRNQIYSTMGTIFLKPGILIAHIQFYNFYQ